MKKFLSILFLVSVAALPAFSSVTTEEIKSGEYILRHGHSDEMVRLIDLQDNQINGTPSKYRCSNPEWYEVEPFTTLKKVVLHFDKTPEDNAFAQANLNEVQPFKFVRHFFMYLDKTNDDGKFMQNEIKYTNRYDAL